MFTNIAMIEFKSWINTRNIQVAPLTGFFGANSSGKSSILQMLIMLKATIDSSNRNVLLETNIKDYVELGTLHDIVNNKGAGITLFVEWHLDYPLRINDILLPQLEFIVTIGVYHEDKTQRLIEFTYAHTKADKKVLSASMGRRDKKNYVSLIINDNEVKFTNDNVGEPIKSYGFSSEAINACADVLHLNDLVLALEQQFARVYHLGPVREYTHRNYGWGGDRPSDVGRMGERSILALLAGGEAMISKIAYWLKEMGLSASFNIKKIIGTTYQVELTHIGSEKPVLLPDMGFGVSQVLPVLVACYYAPEGSTLLIEQPEMHLHPSAQSVLADMFIEVMRERKVQLIIESHSEHLLARLQRRMAEAVLDVNQTAFYFCQLRDGESHITPLEMDEYGEIKNYPDDFFGDLTGDVFERARMSIERRMQQVSE